MKYIIRRKIPHNKVIQISEVKSAVFSEHIKHLIESREVIHNEDLNIDYVVLDVFTVENYAENCLEIRVIVDIIGDNRDKEFYNQLNTLYDHLGELLPTKRPEKVVGRKKCTL